MIKTTLWESDVIMERARNRYIDSVLDKETEEDERYAEDCRGNHSSILEEFEELKAKHEKLFEEELWDKMKYFVECYYVGRLGRVISRTDIFSRERV